MKLASMLIHFIKFFVKNHRMILQLAKKDFKTRYLGSYLGILWAFLQPTATIAIYWFVFQVGFKSVPVDNVPFILWLVPALIPWFFFSDALQGATGSIIENSYLVKKVVFRVSLLPIVKIGSALAIHIFFIVFLTVMFMIYGFYPDIYIVQVLYYLIALILLILGLSWITSALVIFMKDIGQLVGMLLQFGFWLTPIIYSIQMVPERFRMLFKFNPMFYIVEGYRNTFVHKQWFWQIDWMQTAYFWFVVFAVLLIGGLLFKRLRPHFADVI